MIEPPRSLQLSEAQQRRELLEVTSYDVRLDLAADEATFGSQTTIRFTSAGGATFADLKPQRVNAIRLNGSPVDPDLLDRGRLPLDTAAGENELYVDAVMRFRNDGEGLHRSVDPADGKHYVYGMSFMDAAPSWFACFDQPDLKAPYTLHVTAPPDWTVIGNAPGEQVEQGFWEFQQTQPLSTYFVTLVAGPYHVLHDEHPGIPLSLSARQSLAPDLEKDADELFTLTKQCFDEFHRLFGIRYPFGNYHQAFVPEFNAGAMENPGCVTFRDPLIFSSRVTRGARIKRAIIVAHEMAHQWFGNITTPVWWDDLWLNESFAEYMGNRVTADVTQYDDAWVHNAYERRQWGLVADQRPSTHPVAGNGALDASAALQDFDGISYTKGSSVLKQLNATLGDEVFFRGTVDHFTKAWFGNATMHDLFACWERAGAGDLSGFTKGWLRSAGPDQLQFDREDGVVVSLPPAGQGWDRVHDLRAAVAGTDGQWRMERVTVSERRTDLAVAPGEAVVLDPYEETWALTLPDQLTVEALPLLMPRTGDPMLRAGIWNTVRSGFHNASVLPEHALLLLEAWLPGEDNDDAVGYTLPWAVTKLAPLSSDPLDALRRINAAARARAGTARPGGTLQLAAFQGMVSSSTEAVELLAWRRGSSLPERLELDLDLRWRILVQLASMGEIDVAGLADELSAERTARAAVEHARAKASRPDPAAKAWAWQAFTGKIDLPNYELEAVGQGMWRPGQELLTEEYVERFFDALPGLPQVHAGWVLGTVVDAFFPITSVREETSQRAAQLLLAGGLDPTVKRKLVDQTDELNRRLAVRRLVAD